MVRIPIDCPRELSAHDARAWALSSLWFEWFEWFGPSPIEPFNSGERRVRRGCGRGRRRRDEVRVIPGEGLPLPGPAAAGAHDRHARVARRRPALPGDCADAAPGAVP